MDATICDLVDDCGDQSDEKSPAPCQGNFQGGEAVFYVIWFLIYAGLALFSWFVLKPSKMLTAVAPAGSAQPSPVAVATEVVAIPQAPMMVSVSVPAGAVAGSTLQCRAPNGQMFAAVLPPNAAPGMILQVSVPVANPVAAAPTAAPAPQPAPAPPKRSHVNDDYQILYVLVAWCAFNAAIIAIFLLAGAGSGKTQQIAFYITQIVFTSLVLIGTCIQMGQKNCDVQCATCGVWCISVFVFWLLSIILLSVDGIDPSFPPRITRVSDFSMVRMCLPNEACTTLCAKPLCGTIAKQLQVGVPSSERKTYFQLTGRGCQSCPYAKTGSTATGRATSYPTSHPTRYPTRYPTSATHFSSHQYTPPPATPTSTSTSTSTQTANPPLNAVSSSTSCASMLFDLGSDQDVAMVSLENAKKGIAFFSVHAQKDSSDAPMALPSSAMMYRTGQLSKHTGNTHAVEELIRGPMQEQPSQNTRVMEVVDFMLNIRARYIEVRALGCWCKDALACEGALSGIEIYTGKWDDYDGALQPL